MHHYSLFATRLCRLLVAVSMLLTSIPTSMSAAAVADETPPNSPIPQSFPTSVLPGEESAQPGALGPAIDLSPSTPEQPPLRAGAVYSCTLYLPFIAQGYDARPAAEVGLEKQVEPWLALPGEVVTYTLVVTSRRGLAVAEGVLVDHVPPEVEVLEAEGAEYDGEARELRWDLGRLEPGQGVTVTFQARVAEGTEMSVVQNGAVFTGKPQVTAVATATLLVGEAAVSTLSPEEGGELASPDGRVRLVAPAGAVAETTAVRVADFPLPEWEPGEPRWLALFDVQAVEEALRDENGHTRFLQPLTVTVDLSERAGWMEAYLLHFEDLAGEIQQPVPSEFDPETGVLTATVQVFSGHGAAGRNPFPTDGSHFLFQNWPQTSLYSGAATYVYPIETPPGRNGMGPDLSLVYSSRSVDGLLGVAQSPDVGMGWSIGGGDEDRAGDQDASGAGRPQRGDAVAIQQGIHADDQRRLIPAEGGARTER